MPSPSCLLPPPTSCRRPPLEVPRMVPPFPPPHFMSAPPLEVPRLVPPPPSLHVGTPPRGPQDGAALQLDAVDRRLGEDHWFDVRVIQAPGVECGVWSVGYRVRGVFEAWDCAPHCMGMRPRIRKCGYVLTHLKPYRMPRIFPSGTPYESSLFTSPATTSFSPGQRPPQVTMAAVTFISVCGEDV